MNTGMLWFMNRLERICKMTPLKAIRHYCRYCMNGQENEIRLCPSTSCFFFDCRFGKNETIPRVSALKLIKSYCFDCSGGSVHKRKHCWDKDCVLYQYRLGHNPAIKRPGNVYNFHSTEKNAHQMPEFKSDQIKT